MYRPYLYDDNLLEEEIGKRILPLDDIVEVKTKDFNRGEGYSFDKRNIQSLYELINEVLGERGEYKLLRLDISSPKEKSYDEEFFRELMKKFNSLRRGNIFHDVIIRYCYGLEKGKGKNEGRCTYDVDEGKWHLHLGIFFIKEINRDVMGIELRAYFEHISKKFFNKEINVFIGYRDHHEWFKKNSVNEGNKEGINRTLLCLRYLCKFDKVEGLDKNNRNTGRYLKGVGGKYFVISGVREKYRIRYHLEMLRGFPDVGEYREERDEKVINELRYSNQYQRLRKIRGSLRMCHIAKIREDIGEYREEGLDRDEVNLYLRIEIPGNGMDREDRVEELDLSVIGDEKKTLLGSMGNCYYYKGKVYMHDSDMPGRVLSSMSSVELRRYWESLKSIVENVNLS